ncbi:MAG: LUD domain-containing protein [Halobacteriota archaeon]
MSSAREQKAAAIRRLLDEEGDSVFENVTGFNQGRYDSTGELDDYQALREEARQIKEDAIDRLPELIDELTESVEANGGTVYVAEDAADANRYIREVAEESDADSLVKSKSMTSEELEVNDALESAGVDVWETDLGEFVLQVADEAPSHIVAPAIHKSREGIADLFNEHFEPDPPLETAEELTMFAREYLGERIKGADIGMTGANFLAADTGTMALVTSEGNARKTMQATDTHIAVAGVEKVIPTVEDLAPFIELIGRSGTGQDITSYISLLTPPTDNPTFDGDSLLDGDADRDFHLVLVDNGRMEMREDEVLRETLYCIRCSACSNVCANFQHVGGHGFGGETYSGGIATGWEAGVHGYDTAGEFNDLCTGCSRCTEACPVKIDIPWINTAVRDRINRGKESDLDWVYEGLTPDAEPGGLDLVKRMFGNFGTLAKLGSAFAPLSNWIAGADVSRNLLEEYVGVDSRRPMPEFTRHTFEKWFDGRGGSHVDPGNAEREAVLYLDVYTNYIDPDRGKAAVRVLEALDVHVRVPKPIESGRAPLSQGMVATAQQQATAVFNELKSYMEEGVDVVAIEPSDLAMFRDDYRRLLPEDDYRRLNDASYEVFEYVSGLVQNGADLDALPDGDGEEIAYHSHCQQRSYGFDGYTEDILEALGFDIVTSDVECCGLAGSFGYKQEYYELSVDVGETLAEQFSTEETADRDVLASGTSCGDQLDHLLDRKPTHPIERLDPR